MTQRGLVDLSAVTIWICTVLVLLLSSTLSTAYGETGSDVSDEPVRSSFRSFKLSSENGGFESYDVVEGGVRFVGWSVNLAGFTVSAGPGYMSDTALSVTAKESNGSGDDGRSKDGFVATASTVVPEQWQSEKMIVSVSAWVWADEPLSAYIGINANNMRAVSAYHSGGGAWEYLTVVFPFSYVYVREGFSISLASRKGTSRFDAISPLVIIDDRFDGISDVELRFRERLPRRSHKTTRIAIVGNSTIWGTGTTRNGTISYILQSKLETLFPGRFEVVNYGIGCWNLANQIISIRENFVYKTWCNESGRRLTPDNIRDSAVYAVKGESSKSALLNQDNAVTLAELDPDVIILASLWNDIIYPLFYDNWPPGRLTIDGTPVAVLYMKAIFDYMDDPSVEKYKTAMSLYEVREGGANKVSLKVPEDERSLIGSESFESFKQIVSSRYELLVDEFIRRAREIAEIWLFTLPSKGMNKYEELIDKAPKFMSRGSFLISDISDETLTGYHYLFNTAGRIERAVLMRKSREYRLPFIDVRDKFIRDFSALSVADYTNLGYFHDTIHFTYRGNQWIADRIFMQMKRRFAELAKSRGRE